MADVQGFFNQYLPKKIAGDPDLAQSVDAVFQFRIAGAGDWVLDLKDDPGVREGTTDAADCTIKTDEATWSKILDKPSKAIQMVMMGKLKIDNLGLATALQKILT